MEAKAGDQRLGIALASDITLKADWRKAAEALGAVLIGGFSAAFGLGSGVPTGVAGLIKAATASEATDDLGEKAWRLILLCFSWAVGELRAETSSHDPAQLKASARKLVRLAQDSVKNGQAILPADFLRRPTEVPLYQVLREAAITSRADLKIGSGETDEVLRYRLDSAFRIGVFEIWARRADEFAAILAAVDSRVVAPAQSEIEWRAYRQALINAFHVRPVFGQEETKISLSQLYVPLRATWTYPTEGEIEREELDYKDVQQGIHAVDLETELRSWLESPASDYIRIIGGGPGSGKSTSLRSFASQLAEEPNWRPVFIPLQYIDITGDLKTNINRYLVDRTSGPFSAAPITRESVESGPPLVLIFDGLDELSTPGDAAKDIANLFVAKLAQLSSEIRGDGGQIVKIVVSGRLPSFQAARKYLSAPGRKSLEVQGFAKITENLASGGDIAQVDQRPVWWSQYAALAGLELELPPAFKDDRLTR